MRIKPIDFNKIFDPNMVITSTDAVNKDNEFTDEGIYSEKIFGSYQDNDSIDKIGWIDLGPNNHIIRPIAFDALKRLFLNKLDKVISFNKTINKDGEIEDVTELLEEINIEEEPHVYTGLVEFRENFDQILKDYIDEDKLKTNDNYKNDYEFVKYWHSKGLLFINKIPVFSSKLRPAMMVGKTLVLDEINNHFNFIIEYSNELKDTIEDGTDLDDIKILKLPLLYQIQLYANQVMKTIINEILKGKKGIFRKIIYGTRINFSARNVISPMTDDGMNNVHLPYRTFLELYKFPLINIVSTVKNINYNEAHKFFRKASRKFCPEMYKYINELMNKTKGGLHILLNRNPTINIGSILMLEITKIKPNYDDLTLSVSNNILAALGGDYDGDVLNIVPLFTEYLKETFSLLRPENLIISKNDGTFNRDFGLDKDQKLGIHILNN